VEKEKKISIEVKAVSKSYKNVKALDDISITINKGELFGFIGPDGGGKTSLFRIIATLLYADSGEVSLEGLDAVKDYKKIRKIIGYMPGKFSLYQDLSVEENLKFFATVYGTTIEENYDLIKDIYVQIEPFKKRKAGKLSGGMKQKLALSCALIHKPDVLILDEPTTGVDALSRKEFWEMLKKLKEKEITILVSTPYMDEASLCERIALIQNGRILGIDTPEKITSQFDKSLFAIRSKEMFRLLKDMRGFPGVFSIFPFGDYLHFTPLINTDNTEQIQAFLDSKKHQDVEIKKINPNIEDCFMWLMQKNKAD
jgi:ABC-2 type transport system ATP-binding protein